MEAWPYTGISRPDVGHEKVWHLAKILRGATSTVSVSETRACSLPRIQHSWNYSFIHLFSITIPADLSLFLQLLFCSRRTKTARLYARATEKTKILADVEIFPGFHIYKADLFAFDIPRLHIARPFHQCKLTLAKGFHIARIPPLASLLFCSLT